MAKHRTTILLDMEVEREIAPILDAGYTTQVALHAFGGHFQAYGLFLSKDRNAGRHFTLNACIRFDPFHSANEPRFKMEVNRYSDTLWEAEADTAEQALAQSEANLKRLLSEERTAQKEHLATYRRRQAEAAA